MPWSHHTDSVTTALVVQCSCVQFKVAVLVFLCLSGNAPSYVADDSQLNIDSARLTRQCVLFDNHTTPLAISVWQHFYHTRGTHYIMNYDSVTVQAVVDSNLTNCFLSKHLVSQNFTNIYRQLFEESVRENNTDKNVAGCFMAIMNNGTASVLLTGTDHARHWPCYWYWPC